MGGEGGRFGGGLSTEAALDGHDLMDKWPVRISEDCQIKGAAGAKALGQQQAWNKAGEGWDGEPGDDGREKGKGEQGYSMQGLVAHGGV